MKKERDYALEMIVATADFAEQQVRYWTRKMEGPVRP